MTIAWTEKFREFCPQVKIIHYLCGMITQNIKPGTILLVHSNSKLAKIIQNVQMKKDPESGYWNHSGIIFPGPSGKLWVYEATEVEGYKLKGAVRPTPLEDYMNSDRELLFLEPLIAIPTEVMEAAIYAYIGVPYDIPNLAVHQLWLYKVGIWLGRKGAKARRKMVCHEYTQEAWNLMISGLFPNAHKAQVSDIFDETMFKHRF